MLLLHAITTLIQHPTATAPSALQLMTLCTNKSFPHGDDVEDDLRNPDNRTDESAHNTAYFVSKKPSYNARKILKDRRRTRFHNEKQYFLKHYTAAADCAPTNNTKIHPAGRRAEGKPFAGQ